MKINFQKKNYILKGNLLKNQIFIKENINYFILKKKKIINYFLLDGPPFANGKIHLGHILNKIIKNIIINIYFNNNLLLLNNLGWDTHGLPIEQKILIEKKNFINFRLFVCKTIKEQKKDFLNLNLFNSYYNYNTMEPRFESFQIKIFQYLLIKSLIKLENYPNFLCYNCNSTLSFSEVIYKKKKSYSYYFKIKIKNLYIIIWTTTLWSIINNQACFFVKNNIYVIFKSKKCFLTFLINVYKKVLKITSIKGKIVSYLNGSFFFKKKYHIFLNNIFKFYNRKLYLIKNNYIDKNLGTGFIHCAPSNGIEDFELYIKKKKIYNFITTKCLVKKINLFLNLNIFYLNILIFKLMFKRNILLKKKKITHKYMFCWRHKNLVIYFLNKQVFLNLNFFFRKYSIKQIILFNLKKIFFLPKKTKKLISNMINLRSNWCISRQRIWGVYIYYNNSVKKESFSFYKNITKTFSSHIFFFLKKEKLNILDVWFDSSISSILFNKNNILIEGKDQIRGWFQSCIIIQCLLYFNLNIKFLIMHNFCVNMQGEKFSKSEKNFIKIEKIYKLHSIEIIKYYFSKHNFFKNIFFNNFKIKNLSISYKKIRIFFKFIINNFYNFNFKKKQILLIDYWLINKIYKFIILINNNFKKYNYYKSMKIIIFIINFLINNYFSYSKNKLYLSKLNSLIRNSSLFTLYNILLLIKKSIFPILSFTFNEIFNFIKNKKKVFIKKNIKFSYILKFKKKNLNKIILYSNVLRFINKIKKELINLNNINLNIYNNFWNWFIIKKYYNYSCNTLYCYFSKDFFIKKKYIINKKLCKNCVLNKLHNLEELRFYV
ncbi:class I tRNA ligase family protein [Candidatus Carsonella ruddii]|uniref:isoleucine--tRNA ligase n=1 Tax=Candidatus Carsonella ruddii PC isolate NHV TaxID=1202540 RepID=J3VQX9_CARRU|nr:class I tRNA ligase family protein [Candidatus Carsonella ruddii]AFP84356.1 isoleucyl-tRNA synthetase [Candidatus Carsonella ruddii PC isolate NHV]